jgi:PhoH-like ATPase
MSRKTFVLDVNVLLHDPEALFKFPHSEIVLPLPVIEELDTMKRLHDDLGSNARQAIRLLDSLKERGIGDLHKGVELDNQAIVKVQIHTKNDNISHIGLLTNNIKNRILMAALSLKESGQQVVFVSKDFAMRVKAEALGIDVEDYENLKFSYDNIYKGIKTLITDKSNIDLFYKDGGIALETQEKFYPNEYCILTSPEHTSAVAKYNTNTNKFMPLLKIPQHFWGVLPLNVEQKCAIDLLLRDDIKLVTLVGQAGTGKTLLALACGLRKVFDENVYTKILVSRPIMPLGKDIGYLPGLKEEKLFHWMQPIYDNLEYLCSSSGGGSESSEVYKWVTESKKLEMEAVTYIRGRSLPKAYMIIDEAQNLTPHEIKTVISRAGQNTKVILTGDPTQIDNPYLDKDSNGLTYTIGKFKDQKIYGHIFFEKTERSELAALAAKMM